MIKVKAVVFDYGKVLSLPPDQSAVEAMSKLLELEPEKFQDIYAKHRGPYDGGKIDADTYWRIFAKEAEREITSELINQIVAIDFASWIEPNQTTIKWVPELRASGIKAALLSNMPPDHRQYIEDNCHWLPKFDFYTYSGDVGYIKPEPEIYQHCLGGLGIEPVNAVFLDDKPENVEGATQSGMHGILFSSASQAKDDLAKRFDLRLP
jgi:putative hydrolase of the HAD superfamily